MASLIDTLYPLPAHRRTPLTLFNWWESRRGLYNRVVGRTGLITLAGVLTLHPARAEVFGPELALVVLAYGVLANACYSLGWVVELAASALWGPRAPDLGPLLFREGVVFSVVVTLFPLLLTTVFAAASVLFS